MPALDELGVRAVHAAISVAKSLGVRCTETEVLSNSANTLVLLQPASFVARVATTTGLVWSHAEERLRREVDLATYLKAKDIPVVSPTNAIEPGPHEGNGLQMTFWEYMNHDASSRPSPEQLAPHLAELHIALRSYPGALPFLSPALEETKKALDYLQRSEALQPEDLNLLNRAWTQIEKYLVTLSDATQPLHGDAHPGNIICNDGRFLWTDLEDCCSGPIAWDLACLNQSLLGNYGLVLAAYGLPANESDVDLCSKARRLQGVVWLSCLAHRFPSRHAEASTSFHNWRESLDS